MRVARPILVAVSASAVAALVPLSGVASAVEEPPHRVAARDGDFEIRDYPALSVAEVTVQGDRNSAAYAGFRKLAGLIFGANARKQSIKMTDPSSKRARGAEGVEPELGNPLRNVARVLSRGFAEP